MNLFSPKWCVTIAVISAHMSSRDRAECVIRNETGIISIAMIPTCSSGSDDSTPMGELSSERKFVYGYRPIPMPWIKTIGSFVLEVCGRYQYVVYLAGERWRVMREYGRKGKSEKNCEREVR